ncbi:hypothetical protein BO70DRAFT_393206 [Aspergillus heteromorphus CBS 117.55]|uniref:FAD-binding PCMH-type domain-containing protein n=1 Tax=Aspergillus heteromorphus CBS 117.55 TaxID=1448321 RepID=A0A317WZ55_9EURO|nr:uncharacterized protein BO70DRAFT_393206 [Aspergillus heteromorphus CBS 117.55]PWY90018.1 hypothetical protein BO70DRAFT_393206 [Aspergillus heteromorphus CBS 117.55]
MNSCLLNLLLRDSAKRETIERLWGTQATETRFDNGQRAKDANLYAYIQLCTEARTLAFHEGGRYISLRTCQQLLAIAQQLRDGRTRDAIKRSAPLVNLCEGGGSKSKQDVSINLAARLLLMCDFGRLPFSFSGRLHLSWTEGSLADCVRQHFSAPPVLVNTPIKLERMFMSWNIEQVAGMDIVWTDNVVDHLRMMGGDRKVAVFHHVTFLQCQLNNTMLPPGLIQETLQTLSFLFPPNDPGTRTWIEKNHSLRVDPRLLKCGHLRYDDRHIDNFRFWRDRLVLLKQAFDESRPQTMLQWWWDRRDGIQCTTYPDFTIPELSQLIATLLNSRANISVLEIGPGPKSILGDLPSHLRQKVRRYAAFEPKSIFVTRLEEWLGATEEMESPLPGLECAHDIYRVPFVLDSESGCGARVGDSGSGSGSEEKLDIILFCHSLYGMEHQARSIARALDMLVEGGIVVVFHRDGTLRLEGLVAHRVASFPEGVIRIADTDEALDQFAPFIAGFVMQDIEADRITRAEWRNVCRALGGREETHPDYICFRSPEIMVVFTRHATALPGLVAQVPLAREGRRIKNCEARFNHSAAIVRPETVRHVQLCVQWALEHGVGLTVVVGSHSGHCLWTNVVGVDMAAFDQVHVLVGEWKGEAGSDADSLVVAGAGSKTGDIVRKSMAAGVTVPLGSRPSIGAGLWLQDGIGHLARLYGLACDQIVGAVMISVESGEVFCIGCVPSQHWPVGAVRPRNEIELLWAIKGAGTNFGIVISFIFKAYVAPTYLTRSWIVSLRDGDEARRKLHEFDTVHSTKKVSRHLSRRDTE